MKKFLILILLSLSCNCFAHETTVVLLTGLPCSGKTTIANGLHDLFPESVVIDGDVVRGTINKDLGFTKEDREENLRRVIEMTKMVSHSTPLVFLAFVSPYDSIRQEMKDEIEAAGMTFCEVFVKASLETCIERDCKGMYAKAISGEMPNFTGFSDLYEAPKDPLVTCKTDREDISESLDKIIQALGKTNPTKAHALFIGRWSPFHKGHFGIMKKVYEENPDRPLLVLVRNNEGEYWSASERKGMVEAAMKEMNIPATVTIVSDIDSVNWGRDVGYTPRCIDLDVASQENYSGSLIRRLMDEEGDAWKDLVCDGVADYLLSIPSSE